MKKKFLKAFILFVITISVTGCLGVNSLFDSVNNSEDAGRMYNIVSLTDKNVVMFQGIVPEGWTASISSQNLVNSTHPFVETVVISSPDKSASITILSQHSYTENSKFKEGENKDYYTTYLHKMDASTYLDYFMNRIFKTTNVVKNGEIDSSLQEQLKTLHKLKLSLAEKDREQLLSGTSNYNVKITIGDEGYSSSKKEYLNGTTYYEASTCVSAISTNLKSSLSSLLDSKATVWYMPYVVVYQGNTQEDFDKYYEDYNFIMANSSFTKDYYAMVEYVSSAIVNAYTSYYAAKSKAALDAMNDYIDSNYSSTSSESINDRVMQMWDDVIKEEDVYTTEDGTSIRTSMYNETVAQNGDEIYIGSKAGIPIGFNELHKDH